MEPEKATELVEQIKLVDAILGAAVTAVILGGVVWTYLRAARAFSEVQRAYEAGATFGEIIAEGLELPPEARQQLHRDIRKMEGRDSD